MKKRPEPKALTMVEVLEARRIERIRSLYLETGSVKQTARHLRLPDEDVQIEVADMELTDTK